MAGILRQEEVPVLSPEVLWRQNKPDGFMCVSCAWAKPKDAHLFEFCENGAKATAWEVTDKTVTSAFFSEHSVAELRIPFSSAPLGMEAASWISFATGRS